MGLKAVSFIEKHGLSVLVCLLFVLQGAKQPVSFFIWGSVALFFCALSQWKNPEFFNLRRHAKELLFLFCVGVSFFFSKDPSSSLFLTAQIGVFVVLWIWIKSNPSLTHNNTSFYGVLTILAVLTLLKTAFQMGQGFWGWGHSYGFLPSHPGINAFWMSCLACVFLTRQRFVWERPLAIALIGMVLVGPSRGSFIALGVGLIYVAIPFLTFRRVAGAGIALLILLCLIPEQAIYRRIRMDEGNYRLKFGAIALRAAADRPWVGYGLGNFEMAYQRYAFPVETDYVRFARTTDYAHNEYLQMASDLGIPACIIFLASFFPILLSKSRVSSADWRSAKAGLYAVSVTACFLPIWHTPLFLFLTLYWCGTIYHLRSITASAGRIPQLSRIHWVTVTGSVLILGSLEVILGWCALRDHWADRQQWSRILRWNSQDAWAWKRLADQQRDPCKEGIDFYARAVARVPDQLYFREAYGRAIEACHPNYGGDQAIEQYAEALRLAPHRAINALAIGRMRFVQGDIQTALKWFETADQMEPHFWESDRWRARCYFMLGDRDRALWTLQHLRKRRTTYLELRNHQIEKGLPWPNTSSDYSRIILDYDDHIIEKEIKVMRRFSRQKISPKTLFPLQPPPWPPGRSGIWIGT